MHHWTSGSIKELEVRRSPLKLFNMGDLDMNESPRRYKEAS